MKSLNPQQAAAVEYTDGPLLVVAGAGSGKTRVITEKIAYLIRQQHIAAHHIAAITFTNKAAREMQLRVKSLLKKEQTRGLQISTFHTLGLKIIRQELKALDYKPGFSIFDAQDSAVLLKELARKEEVDEDDTARWQISSWKNDFINPERAIELAQDDTEAFHARLYARYQRQLKAYNAVDFDDLIVAPATLLQQNAEVREKWQRKLHYLLIDEYQDTNACQYLLVKLLAGAQSRFTAVGDDDQSVYSWRGARPENLDLLHQDYPTLKLVKLEQNYRSTESILKAANELITHNPHKIEKQLWSALGPGEPLRVIPCKTADNEAERIISEIMKLKFKHRADYGEFAILYRGNHQSRLFERKLREQSISYKVSGGTSFFDRSEVKDIVAYLRLIANPDDDAAFLRIVNTPRREIGTATLEKLGDYAGQREVSLFTASFELGLAETLTQQALQRLQRFTDWLNEMHRRADCDAPTLLIKAVINGIDYEDWLRDISSTEKVAERRIENLGELVGWIDKLAKKNTRSLAEIIHHMTLMDIMERNEDDTNSSDVQLITLHAAKGMEFPYVFIAGMEEELLPHRTSIEEENLEEERRLAYVGITRAQRLLTFTYTRKRQRFGEEIDCEPSRFLNEIPSNLLEWDDPSKVTLEQQQETGRAHLNNIRNMLAN
jgi:ATP-dependent DNA helicase Rep